MEVPCPHNQADKENPERIYQRYLDLSILQNLDVYFATKTSQMQLLTKRIMFAVQS